MSEIVLKEVKIVELKSMRMVSIYGYGDHPEDLAWKNLQDWVQKNNIQLDPQKHQIFGFNNPCPSAGSTRYGYEFWISMDQEIEPEGEIRVVDFNGGLYAVAEFDIDVAGIDIPQYWNALNIWGEKSKYSMGQHQWLEEHTVDGKPYAMYLPINR